MQALRYSTHNNTYTNVIARYSRHLRTEEAFNILRKKKRFGYEHTLNSYRNYFLKCGRLQILEETENLFKEMEIISCKLDRSAYHIIIKGYKHAGEYEKGRKTKANKPKNNLLDTNKLHGQSIGSPPSLMCPPAIVSSKPIPTDEEKQHNQENYT